MVPSGAGRPAPGGLTLSSVPALRWAASIVSMAAAASRRARMVSGSMFSGSIDGSGKVLSSLQDVAQAQVHLSPVDQRRGVLRVEPQGLVKGLQGGIQLILDQQDGAERRPVEASEDPAGSSSKMSRASG